MLSWALRYLAVGVAVAIGFAALQGGDWLEPPPGERSRNRSVGAKPAGDATSQRARAEQDAGFDDAWTEDQGWTSDDGWADDADGVAPQNDGAAESTRGLLELVVRAGPRGHFVVGAEVDGTPLTFLIDTGASDIVLSQADARRLGLEPRTLDYSRSYQTANGIVRAAPVKLRELRLGQLQLYDLDASVNERPLPVSLLGMSFLSRLQGYEVADNRLILRW